MLLAIRGILCRVTQKCDFATVFLWRVWFKAMCTGAKSKRDGPWGLCNVPTCVGQIIFSRITFPVCF